MTLTPVQQAILEAPFRASEHRFKAGQVYIIKSAIRRRLSEADPGWSEGKPEQLTRDTDMVSVSLPLTVAGTTRYGVGTGIIQRWIVDKNTGAITSELQGYDLALATTKALKTAATDALARAAVEFNIGGYLKDKPSKVKESDFNGWLAGLPGSHWSFNGGRQRVGEFMKLVHLEWDSIKALVEPSKVLTGLSDTTLSEVAFTARLAELAFKPAAPKLEATTASH